MTQKPAWTPGEWVAELSDSEIRWRVMSYRSKGPQDSIRSEIADCGSARSARAKANAHLISAARDLYEACAEFVRKVDAGEAKSTNSYRQMKSALAKARGHEDGAML